MSAYPIARIASPALLAAALCIAVPPAVTQAASPLRLSVSPKTVEAPGTVTVRLRGGGGAACKLTVQLDRRGSPVRLVRRIRTSLRLSIGPSSAPGRRVVRVRCAGRSASTRFTVVAVRSSKTPFSGPRLLFAADGGISSVPVADPTRALRHVVTPSDASILGLDASPTRLVWTQLAGNRAEVLTAALDGSGRRVVYRSRFALPLSGVLVGSAYYWIEDEAIARADLDTGAVDPVFIALPPPPEDLAALGPAEGLASDGRWLYFASCAHGAIGRVGLDGEGLDGRFVTLGDECVQDVAVSGTHIYWPNLDASIAARGTLGRAAIDGSRVQPKWLTTRGAGVLGNWGVAADETHVYWTSSDPAGGKGYIGRVRADGTGMRPKFLTRDRLAITISIAP